MKNNTQKLKPFGLIPSFLLFGSAAIILFLEANYLIPYLTSISGIETVIWWFVVSAFGMFIPLILLGLYLLKKEKAINWSTVWKDRLRFRKMNSGDWIWSAGGIIIIGILSFAIMTVLQAWFGKTDHQPPFMQFEPLEAGRYWILAVWLPYWFFNIMGEEFLWRGVILPRQEVSFGKYAWLINGAGWGLFHIAFGWQLFITLLPILFIQSFIVQKRKNSWIGVIIHGVINGPSFIAICFGLI